MKLGTKDLILEAVDHEYLSEIEHDTLGFLNQTPRQMIQHLLTRGGALDFADTKDLLTERDGEWDVTENPQIYFNRVEKAIKGLQRNGITSDLNERRDIALFHLKATGEFDVVNGRPNLRRIKIGRTSKLSSEYAKENIQNKLTAKQFKVNALVEQAETTEELIATLTESHTKQWKYS